MSHTPDPFGYFRQHAFGWEDCCETDDDAIPLFDEDAIQHIEKQRNELLEVETNLRQQVAHLIDQLAGKKSNVELANRQRDELDKRVEGLINKLSDHQRQAAIGKAIERACGELPEGFDLQVECEQGAATVRMWIQDTDTFLSEFGSDCTLAEEIDNAINIAKAKGGA